MTYLEFPEHCPAIGRCCHGACIERRWQVASRENEAGQDGSRRSVRVPAAALSRPRQDATAGHAATSATRLQRRVRQVHGQRQHPVMFCAFTGCLHFPVALNCASSTAHCRWATRAITVRVCIARLHSAPGTTSHYQPHSSCFTANSILTAYQHHCEALPWLGLHRLTMLLPGLLLTS